jgi:hypothetical protein
VARRARCSVLDLGVPGMSGSRVAIPADRNPL